MSLALSKHKLDSWKTPKPTHWRKLDPHKWMARSWYTLGRTIENANSWLEAFWSNSGLWWFKVVFQNTTIFLLYLFRRKLRILTNQYISPRTAKHYPPNIAKFFSTRTRPSCTRLFTCRLTARVFIWCEGQLEKLYSRNVIIDGVSLILYHMYRFNSYGFSVAQFNVMQ